MGEVVKLKAIKEEARQSSLPEDFCWFWSEYPRKEKKGDAFKAWKQTENIRPQAEEVIAAVNKYADKCRYKEIQFVMLPATWLRAWAWADE